MQIGLTISKTFAPDPYTSVAVSFWMVKEIKQNRITKYGYISLVPYANRAYWTNNGDKSYYPPGEVVFSINPSNWPFVTGTDPVSKAWTFIKTFGITYDEDGNITTPGGIDWTTAVDEMYP